MITADINTALMQLVSLLLQNARADSAANVLLCRVITPYAAKSVVNPDTGLAYPWPASVDVQVVPWYTRRVENVALKRALEVPLQAVPGGLLVTGPEEKILNVPILFIGTEDLSLTSVPLPGSLGLLLLTGKHHGVTMSTGAPDQPRLAPTTERLSDSLFIPGFFSGVQAVTLPPEVQPAPGSMSQIGPRTIEGETTYLRKKPGGWILGGQSLQFGSPVAAKRASGVGDTVTLDPTILTFFAAVNAILGVPVPANPTGTIATGSSAVLLP